MNSQKFVDIINAIDMDLSLLHEHIIIDIGGLIMNKRFLNESRYKRNADYIDNNLSDYKKSLKTIASKLKNPREKRILNFLCNSIMDFTPGKDIKEIIKFYMNSLKNIENSESNIQICLDNLDSVENKTSYLQKVINDAKKEFKNV